MRVTAKGQVSLPKPLRDAVGMPPGSEVTVTLDGGRIVIAKAFTAVKVDRRAELRAAAAKVRESMDARFRRLGADKIVAFLRPDDEQRD